MMPMNVLASVFNAPHLCLQLTGPSAVLLGTDHSFLGTLFTSGPPEDVDSYLPL